MTSVFKNWGPPDTPPWSREPITAKSKELQRWRTEKYSLDKNYNFVLDLIAIRGLHVKLCASKVTGVLAVGISRLPLGSPKTKSHLDVPPVKSYKIYSKGEGGGFPQVRAMMSLVSLRLVVARPSTQSAPTMH